MLFFPNKKKMLKKSTIQLRQMFFSNGRGDIYFISAHYLTKAFNMVKGNIPQIAMNMLIAHFTNQ